MKKPIRLRGRFVEGYCLKDKTVETFKSVCHRDDEALVELPPLEREPRVGDEVLVKGKVVSKGRISFGTLTRSDIHFDYECGGIVSILPKAEEKWAGWYGCQKCSQAYSINREHYYCPFCGKDTPRPAEEKEYNVGFDKAIEGKDYTTEFWYCPTCARPKEFKHPIHVLKQEKPDEELVKAMKIIDDDARKTLGIEVKKKSKEEGMKVWCSHWVQQESKGCWKLFGTEGKPLYDFAEVGWNFCQICGAPRPAEEGKEYDVRYHDVPTCYGINNQLCVADCKCKCHAPKTEPPSLPEKVNIYPAEYRYLGTAINSLIDCLTDLRRRVEGK